jgi:nucleotide-binding universal stress UspA family protein
MRYLVAIDGWEASRRALSLAATQARATDEIEVVHVVDEDGGDPDSVEQIRTTAEEVVAEVDGETDVAVRVLETDKDRRPATRVGDRLLAYVDEHDHDVVYLGNEHTGTAEKMIVGSVSATLIERRSVPVVLVP